MSQNISYRFFFWTIALGCLAVLSAAGCGSEGIHPGTLTLSIDKEFRGAVWIVVDPTGIEIPNGENGDAFLSIPKTGIIRVKSLQFLKPIGWTVVGIDLKKATKIHPTNRVEPARNDVSVHDQESWTIIRGNTKYTGLFMFIGTEDNYQTYLKSQKPGDLEKLLNDFEKMGVSPQKYETSHRNSDLLR